MENEINGINAVDDIEIKDLLKDTEKRPKIKFYKTRKFLIFIFLIILFICIILLIVFFSKTFSKSKNPTIDKVKTTPTTEPIVTPSINSTIITTINPSTIPDTNAIFNSNIIHSLISTNPIIMTTIISSTRPIIESTTIITTKLSTIPITSPEVNFTFILKKGKDSQNVLIHWNETIIIDIISINVKGLTNETIRTYNFTNTYEGEALAQVYYGIPKICIYYKKGDYINETIHEFIFPVEELGISPLHGTLPVTLLSLGIFNITNTYNCPIFVGIFRHLSWNWDSLPKNVYLFDFIPQRKDGKIDFNYVYFNLQIWIAQLYKVNKNVKIHLFLNDYHIQVFALYILANNIPEENYDVILLSDGTGSHITFNKNFDNNETYAENYAKMKKKWNIYKKFIWERKEYNDKIKDSRFIGRYEIVQYCFIWAREEKNIYWWLNKINGLFAPNCPQALQDVLNTPHIYLKDTKNLLNALNDTEKDAIKKLYNFNSNYFEKAENLNKSVMVIAGTWHKYETNLYDYCKSIAAFYGDEYIYYYKGHPESPTEHYPDKMKALDDINVTVVDSTIPLEIMFFFNSYIYCSGYYTSAFIEMKNETLKALINQERKDEEYFNKFDFYGQYIKKDDKKYGKFLDNNDDGIILDFNKNKLTRFEYDFGIYLKDRNIIKYFKKNLN